MKNILREKKQMMIHRLRDKSFRKRYTYYYALTFMTSVLVILLANLITQQVVKEQVLLSNQKTLKQFFGLVDEKLDGMVNDAYNIVLNTKWQEFVLQGDGKSVYKKVALIDLLKETATDAYEDAFIWFPYSGRVISGINPIADSIDLRDYCDNIYQEGVVFAERIQMMQKKGALQVAFYPMNKNSDKQLFALSLNRYRSGSRNQNYVLTLVVDCSFMDSYVGEGILAEGEDAMLFNSEGELLYSHRNADMERLHEDWRSTGIYEVDRNGEKYTFLVQESEIMDGFYAIEMSHDVFYGTFSRIRNISYAGIVVSMLIGIFVICQMSRNTYRPLELVMDRFQEEMKQKFDSNRHNEFEYMHQLLDRQEENKRQSSRQTMQEQNMARRKKLLLAALEGREINEEEIDFLENHVELSEYFFGGILFLKSCGKAGWDLLSFVLNNIYEEIFEGRCRCDILSLSGSRHVIVLNLRQTELKETPEEEMERLMLSGMNFLRGNFGVAAVLGLGNICSGLYGLHNLYREAQQALEYFFLEDTELMIRYRQIQGRQLQLPFSEENQIFLRMNAFLKKEREQEENVRFFLEELIQLYGIGTETSMETVACFRYEMLNALNRIWAGSNVEYFQRQSYVLELTEVENLKIYLSRLTRVLWETGMELRENSRKRKVAEEVKQHVEENYANPNLSIASIGEEFGMQAAYLSKIFREEQGVSLLNYISNVRIAQAKCLLLESNLTINEIAEQTGFLSGNVFIKTFKKHTGTTPGKYRLE